MQNLLLKTLSQKLLIAHRTLHFTKIKFSVRDFFSKCEQIGTFLWICSHVLRKYLAENFPLCCSSINPVKSRFAHWKAQFSNILQNNFSSNFLIIPWILTNVRELFVKWNVLQQIPWRCLPHKYFRGVLLKV